MFHCLFLLDAAQHATTERSLRLCDHRRCKLEQNTCTDIDSSVPDVSTPPIEIELAINANQSRSRFGIQTIHCHSIIIITVIATLHPSPSRSSRADVPSSAKKISIFSIYSTDCVILSRAKSQLFKNTGKFQQISILFTHQIS
jgi:hypothetical protein